MEYRMNQPYVNQGYEHNKPDYVFHGLSFIGTCGSYPEQYDVVNAGMQQVGYVRLRGGRLKVYFPDVDGELVYLHFFEEKYKGCFDNEEERVQYLEDIAFMLDRKIQQVKET
jgi:hypothetical protein